MATGSRAAASARARNAACWRESWKLTAPPCCCATLRQIFDAYCNKKSLAKDQMRFLQDGQRINGDTTPEEVRSCGLPPSAVLAHSRLSQRPVLGRGAARV